MKNYKRVTHAQLKEIVKNAQDLTATIAVRNGRNKEDEAMYLVKTYKLSYIQSKGQGWGSNRNRINHELQQAGVKFLVYEKQSYGRVVYRKAL